MSIATISLRRMPPAKPRSNMALSCAGEIFRQRRDHPAKILGQHRVFAARRPAVFATNALHGLFHDPFAGWARKAVSHMRLVNGGQPTTHGGGL